MKNIAFITIMLSLIFMAAPAMAAEDELVPVVKMLDTTYHQDMATAALDTFEATSLAIKHRTEQNQSMPKLYGRYGGSFVGINGAGYYGGAFYGPGK